MQAAQHRELPRVRHRVRERALEERRRRAQAFLDEAARREGASRTASGLVFESLSEGDGAQPGPNDRVRVEYTYAWNDAWISKFRVMATGATSEVARGSSFAVCSRVD